VNFLAWRVNLVQAVVVLYEHRRFFGDTVDGKRASKGSTCLDWLVRRALHVGDSRQTVAGWWIPGEHGGDPLCDLCFIEDFSRGQRKSTCRRCHRNGRRGRRFRCQRCCHCDRRGELRRWNHSRFAGSWRTGGQESDAHDAGCAPNLASVAVHARQYVMPLLPSGRWRVVKPFTSARSADLRISINNDGSLEEEYFVAFVRRPRSLHCRNEE